MNKILLILILTLCFNSWTKADDIREFEIEGMSIGDSLLNYFTETQIKNPKKNNVYFYPNSNRFYEIVLETNNKNYDEIQFSIKEKDNSYEIYNINGTIYFKQNIADCYEKQNQIEKDLSKVININKIDTYPETGKHKVDETGRSTFKAKWFVFKNNDHVGIVCSDYHKDLNLQDSLKLLISTNEYNEFLKNEAYK